VSLLAGRVAIIIFDELASVARFEANTGGAACGAFRRHPCITVFNKDRKI
jgi:hypothetical protein